MFRIGRETSSLRTLCQIADVVACFPTAFPDGVVFHPFNPSVPCGLPDQKNPQELPSLCDRSYPSTKRAGMLGGEPSWGQCQILTT